MPFFRRLTWVLCDYESFAFQAIHKLYAHYTNIYFAVFGKFLGMFRRRKYFSKDK